MLAPILFNLYLESIMGRASKDMCGVEVSVSMPRCGREESICRVVLWFLNLALRMT